MNTRQYPCRYSFPCARTFDDCLIISAQHSLHLYQPVPLPRDYITGQVAEMHDAPLSKDWKRRVRMLPTPGLFAFRQNDKNLPEIAAVHIKKIGTPRPAEGDLRFSVQDTEKPAGMGRGDGERRNPRFLSSLLGVAAGKRRGNDLAVEFGGELRGQVLSPILPSEILPRLSTEVAMSEGRNKKNGPIK